MILGDIDDARVDHNYYGDFTMVVIVVVMMELNMPMFKMILKIVMITRHCCHIKRACTGTLAGAEEWCLAKAEPSGGSWDAWRHSIGGGHIIHRNGALAEGS